ncbi:MAG: hypothetical protein DCC59_01315 [Chloroflexi bacterium]|nr:hypothetical protein [Chloroflexi bacterium CFX1]MCK6567627.1 hypothetical protein [Anaerolineales bacterium]MCQ3952919.1 hypothetical protein [Chloroflexota bacterium]MDL1919948.1 hypothetical protein [Chloroflexi bacterium CFX5]NUQ60102.1 hypothetical protein [Anaerolineales bacterium]
MKPTPSPQQATDRVYQLEEEVKRLQSELAVLRSQKLVEALLKTDGPLPRENRTVIRTAAGLTVNGSRLTLYSIMDSMRGNNSLKNVRDIYELTDEEMLDILDYIHLHKDEVEKEYREALESAERNRKYWEERNRDLMGKTYQQREVVRAKLRELRAQYHAGNKP